MTGVIVLKRRLRILIHVINELWEKKKGKPWKFVVWFKKDIFNKPWGVFEHFSIARRVFPRLQITPNVS